MEVVPAAMGFAFEAAITEIALFAESEACPFFNTYLISSSFTGFP
jgi:hypothetical protein